MLSNSYWDIIDIFGPTEQKLLLSLEAFFSMLNWQKVFNATLYFSLILGITALIFLSIEKRENEVRKSHLKQHFLTISNNGNVPSYYLIRVLNIPSSLNSWVSIFNYPLLVVRKPIYKEEEPEETQVDNAKAAAPQPAKKGQKLIPDLNDPFNRKPNQQAGKALKETEKKVNIFKRFITAVMGILPKSLQKKLDPIQKGAQEVQNGLNNLEKAPKTIERKIQAVAKSGADLVKLSGSTPNNVTRDLRNPETAAQDPQKPRQVVTGEIIYEQTPLVEPGQSIQLGINFQSKKTLSRACSYQYQLEIVTVPQYWSERTGETRTFSGTLHMDKQKDAKTIIYFICICALICLLCGIFAFIGKKVF